jgi:benzoyl-CoA reductase subunit C
MVMSSSLRQLIEAARSPLSDWHIRYPDHKPMGYLCSYVPEEMIHAAGFAPVRLRGTNAPLRQVDASLQSFTCALCRSTLDQIMSGTLDGLVGTVFAHTCDTMQAMADLWRMHMDTSHFLDTVMQPVNLGSPAARPFLISELERFRKSLAAFAGQPITDGALRASISLYDETRRLVAEIQTMRQRLSAPAFFAITDAAQAMPRENVNQLLTELVAELKDVPARPRGPRLFLTGAVLDEPRLLDLIEDLGAQVSGDDLCSGSRHFHGQVGAAGGPIATLADYYLQRPPCPSKLHPEHDPGSYLLDQARQAQADGIVFVIEKFCEPHAFDYALILPRLDQAGLPHLLLEMEQTPSLEAIRTRLQAFVELL